MLLISGCSYTDNYHFPTIAFGEQVYRQAKNVAWGGAGNHYIASSVLDNLNQTIDKVFILWSGLSRLDIEFPVDVVNDIRPYYEGSPIHITGQTAWFHTGGYDGTWCNWTRTKYEKYVYEYIRNQYLPLDFEYLNKQSLKHIVGCLNTLESMNIDYRFGFIYDIFHDYSAHQQSLSGPVDKNEPLLDLINWDKSLSLTPYEFCRENNLLSDDNFHPSSEGYQRWWEIVSENVPFTIS